MELSKRLPRKSQWADLNKAIDYIKKEDEYRKNFLSQLGNCNILYDDIAIQIALRILLDGTRFRYKTSISNAIDNFDPKEIYALLRNKNQSKPITESNTLHQTNDPFVANVFSIIYDLVNPQNKF